MAMRQIDTTTLEAAFAQYRDAAGQWHHCEIPWTTVDAARRAAVLGALRHGGTAARVIPLYTKRFQDDPIAVALDGAERADAAARLQRTPNADEPWPVWGAAGTAGNTAHTGMVGCGEYDEGAAP